MNSFVLKTEKTCDIIGIAGRTTNAAEMQGAGVIMQLWQRFITELIAEKIPNKIDNSVLGLYYDYASDKDGEYSYLLGMRVQPGTVAPDGMVAVQVPESKYTVFSSQKGTFPDVVIDTWMRVWHAENSGEIERAYTFDYELYDERSYDPAAAQMDIYISVR